MKKRFIKLTLLDNRKEVHINMDHIVGVESVDGGTIVSTDTTGSRHRDLKVSENAMHIVGKCEGRM